MQALFEMHGRACHEGRMHEKNGHCVWAWKRREQFQSPKDTKVIDRNGVYEAASEKQNNDNKKETIEGSNDTCLDGTWWVCSDCVSV